MACRIEHYAMIGDCRTSALVCQDGSIDWLCMPRFDTPACFASLLGTSENGHWQIAPTGRAKIERRYRGNTLILETTFEGAHGKARLIDFMPIGPANISVVRLLEGLEGTLDIETELVIRFDYGLTIPWVSRTAEDTRTIIAGPHMLVLRTPVALHGKDMKTVGKFKLHKGERIPFVLTYGESHLPEPAPLDPEKALADTEAVWLSWAGLAKVAPEWHAKIARSLLTLKGLTYSPTGGMVAAATTSLPEQLGGVRNWDYRYCWLRDATFTLLAFLNAGYFDEANNWQNWLMRVIAGAPSQMQTMYGVAGERRLDEWLIDWLPGYEGTKPVRVGNAAALQLQLDVYGELADVMTIARRGGLPPAPRRPELRKAILDHLESIWASPDEGIWEIRGTPQHFTHSKVMTWVAFDRASKAVRVGRADRARWKEIAAEIHADICNKAVDEARGCFVQAYGSTRLDASLLMLPIVGFLPPGDARIVKTVEEIEKHLLFDGLVMRYETESGVDGLPPGEGVFLACSFWLADNYILLGRLKEAEELFNRLVGLANDVGLLSEEYDPRARRMLGNFPQAFSHVALVNTALNLMHAYQAERVRTTLSAPVQRHKA